MVYAAVAFFDSRWIFLMVAYDDCFFFTVGDWMFRCFDYIYDVFLWRFRASMVLFLQEGRGKTNLRIEIA
jgi:hypothetical protein